MCDSCSYTVIVYLNWLNHIKHILILLPLATENEILRDHIWVKGPAPLKTPTHLSSKRYLLLCETRAAWASALVGRNFPLQAALVTVKYGKHAKAMPDVTQSARTKPRDATSPCRHNYLFFPPSVLLLFCLASFVLVFITARDTKKARALV